MTTTTTHSEKELAKLPVARLQDVLLVVWWCAKRLRAWDLPLTP